MTSLCCRESPCKCSKPLRTTWNGVEITISKVENRYQWAFELDGVRYTSGVHILAVDAFRDAYKAIDRLKEKAGSNE